MNVIKIFLLTSILVSFTACTTQADIDEAVATAVAEALATPTPTAIPISTTTESSSIKIPSYVGSPFKASGILSKDGEIKDRTWGNLFKEPLAWIIKVEVIEVIDGDTIKVDPVTSKAKALISKGTTVRYLDIDAPETVHSGKPVECYGPIHFKK